MKRQSFVYVIEAQNALVKIGVSANPFSRAAAVHLHSPVPTRLVAFWPGTTEDEARLHYAFAAARSHAEWFRIEGRVADFLAVYRGTGVDAVVDWDAVTWVSTKEKRRRSQQEINQKIGAAVRAAHAERRKVIEARV